MYRTTQDRLTGDERTDLSILEVHWTVDNRWTPCWPGSTLPVIAPSFVDEGISVGLEMEKMEKRREGKEGSR